MHKITTYPFPTTAAENSPLLYLPDTKIKVKSFLSQVLSVELCGKGSH